MSKTESVNYIKQNNTINNSKIINWLLVTLIVTTIVLIILGYFSRRPAKKVDKNYYNAVIKAYHINDSNVTILN